MIALKHNQGSGLVEFETDEMKGVLQADGDRHGVRQLLHKPSGVEIVNSDLMVLNLFRLFAVHLGMGTPRLFKRTWKVDGNAVEISWPRTDEHHADLVARYEVHEPNLVDLTITVRSQGTYAAYELFLSDYFNTSLRPHLYVKGNPQGPTPEKPELIAPKGNDVTRSLGLVFPRDFFAAQRTGDGRWERDEMGMPITRLAAMRYYAYPFAFQGDTERGMAAVLMSRPQDAFAVITGYDTDDPKDAWKNQNPMYLSLFGNDLLPGDERTVKVRLAATRLDKAMTQPLKHY